MGYDVERFVGEEIENELLCRVCASVLENPVETPCEHYFCMACIDNWRSISETCPIDRQPLQTVDLKQPSRLLRNLLAKLDIKCDFEENGCNTIVKLENLANHRSTCLNNPNAEIICNQGCNLQIKRRDQASDCLGHFLNKVHRQDVEISRLWETVNDQIVENEQLKDDVGELKDIVLHQQQKIEELTFSPISKVRFLINMDIAWKTFENMKTHHDHAILEKDDTSKKGIAQLAHQLDPANPYFTLCVLKSGPWIGMGLANGSALGCVYVSDGRIFLNEKIVHIGEAWQEGDCISCDVKFPENGSVDLLSNSIVTNEKVSFYRNYKEIFTLRSAQLPALFPTIWIGFS